MSGLSQTVEWKALESHASEMKQLHLRDLLQDSSRSESLVLEESGIYMDFSRENVTTDTISMLCNLAKASKLPEKMEAMRSGAKINSTENRSVLHVALRTPKDSGIDYNVDGQGVMGNVHSVLDKIDAFSEKVRSGEWKGCTNKELTTVIAIGIGGSYLGPEFVYEALRTDATCKASAAGRQLKFLANVDPIDAARVLDGCDAESTLVIIVSKTFTTAETMMNAKTVKKWLIDSIPGQSEGDIVGKHVIAVSTAIEKATAFGIDSNNIFGFWDWVGGRYSVCSAVGVMPLSIHFGYANVQQFLDGAHSMDKHFFETPLEENLPVVLGLIGIWNSSFMGYNTRAILPYCQALLRFAAHIQQVDMESNGKRVDMEGHDLEFEAGEIIFGEPGTNGQHSFYQLVHQGRVIPAEFIGFIKSPTPMSIPGEKVCNHDELMANYFAQPDALAYGKTIQELKSEGVAEHLLKHKEFPGNRPSLSFLFDELTAFSVGQLLALYEHRVAVQGFVWGINSFDQWGVELGKALAGNVRNQLKRSRDEAGVDIEGFNSSTATMLRRFIDRS